MKEIHKKSFTSCLLMLLFVLSFSLNSTYTYWASSILGTQTSETGEVTIGSWTFSPYSPTGVSDHDDQTAYNTGSVVWYNGNLWINRGSYTLGNEPSNANNWIIYNDLNWYSTVFYRNGNLIYYNNNIYRAKWNDDGNDPTTSGINGQWENQLTDSLSWIDGQSTVLNEIIFFDGYLWINRIGYTTTEPGSTSGWGIYGNLTWDTNHIYNTGVIVEYNGTYYKSKWHNDGINPSTSGQYGAWETLITPLYNGSVPTGTTYTIYNGLLYKALITINTTNNTIAPGSSASKGIWQAINTQQWQQYNTYAIDDLVMYQNNVYELANVSNSTDIPGTTKNSWNGKATINYNPLNIYELGQYVVYNSNVFVVVNATNANNNAPGVAANAWNQVNGYHYQWFNTYKTGDIVFYQDTVYKALQQTINHEPGLPSSSSYWSLYQI